MSVRAATVPVMVSRVPRREPAFLWLFLGKVFLLFVTILVTYAIYAYLHAYRIEELLLRPDWPLVSDAPAA